MTTLADGSGTGSRRLQARRALATARPGVSTWAGLTLSITPAPRAGPCYPDFAREQGLRPPLRLIMALLSFKTRRAARRQGVRYSFLFMRASGAQLGEITKLIDSAALRPIVDRTYPFDEAPQALAHVESGPSKGKVVITMLS